MGWAAFWAKNFGIGVDKVVKRRIEKALSSRSWGSLAYGNRIEHWWRDFRYSDFYHLRSILARSAGEDGGSCPAREAEMVCAIFFLFAPSHSAYPFEKIPEEDKFGFKIRGKNVVSELLVAPSSVKESAIFILNLFSGLVSEYYDGPDRGLILKTYQNHLESLIGVRKEPVLCETVEDHFQELLEEVRREKGLKA